MFFYLTTISFSRRVLLCRVRLLLLTEINLERRLYIVFAAAAAAADDDDSVAKWSYIVAVKW
jgi:hypothetical protein